MFENGYIKLHRSLLSWEWYKNENTKTVFIHCLLMANFEPSKFEGLDLPAGSFITSYQHLAEQTGLTVSQVRTALDHLILTRCLTRYSKAKFTVISVVNWDLYQGELTQSLANKSQTSNKQIANKSQTDSNRIRKYNKDNKDKKEKKSDPYEIDTSDWDKLPTLSYEEAKKWEAENGRQWEGLIQW